MKLEALFVPFSILWTTLAAAAPPAATPHEGAPLDGVEAGALVLYDEALDGGGTGRLAPQLSQHVELQVTGLIARAHVVQAFENQSDDVVNAVYTFPLPETGAVDGLTLMVGERRIVGQIRERDEAERSYEDAARQGRKASLIEQQRPNLFSTQVANIGPHEVVQVELRYQQDVRYDSGTFALEFPATLTPRYAPASAPQALAGVTPPMALTGGPTLALDVTIDAGVPLARVASPSHALKVQASGAGPVHVSLAEGQVLADRDVRLEWAPTPEHAPRSALFQEQFGGERYALLMVLPPDPSLDSEGRLPRETTFIIDTSGSMSGTSIEQARAALESGLAALRPGDRFNVIQFSDSASAFFPGPVPATPERVRDALLRVQRLAADGGTEMLAALDLAFAAPPSSGALSQVVFVTDGSVGNEPDVFGFIERHLGARRLFTVGIGAAPNQYFMRSAARFGRGTFTAVADINDVGARMQSLWAKLDAPLMQQVAVDFGGDGRTEMWPTRVPDLYRGEPIVVVAKLGMPGVDVQVSGRRAGQPFATSLPLGASPPPNRELGIHRLWARRQIEDLMDRIVVGERAEEIRPRVTELGLRHGIVSQYTSLVAIDTGRTVAGRARDVAVPSAMPAGNTMFGNMPQTATPAPAWLALGLLALGVAGAIRPRRPLRPRHGQARTETAAVEAAR